MQGMKQEFHNTKLILIAEFKRELDERSIGGAGFLNMKTIVEKLDDIEGKVLQKIDSRIMMETDFVSTSAVGNVTVPSPPTAVANESTTIFYCHNATTAFNLYFNLSETTWKLAKGYVFPSMGLYSLVVFWFCGDLSKRISPFMLIPRKDCENDAQKCLVSKMKSTMELVERGVEKQQLLFGECFKVQTAD